MYEKYQIILCPWLETMLAEDQLSRMYIGLTIRNLHSTEAQTALPNVVKRMYYIPEVSLMALSRR